jgi:N6-L-threonylcarbamoyladenine synthase
MQKGCDRIALVGGVAANSRLREKLRSAARHKGICVHIPSLHLCGDNAAMIAAVGYHYLKAGIVSDFQDDVFSRNPLPR